MAAITTDVCLAFPALAAIKAGYDVYAVIDASGTWTAQAELATVMRLTQAGVITTNWIAVAAELKHDEDRDTSVGINKAFGEHMGLYDFLYEILKCLLQIILSLAISYQLSAISHRASRC